MGHRYGSEVTNCDKSHNCDFCHNLEFSFLFGFCVFLFLFWSWVLGSNSAQCASWCFVLVVFLLFFFGGLAFVLGCTRTANRVNALRSSLVVLCSTLGSLFGVLVLIFYFIFLFLRVSFFCFGLGFKSRL